MIGLWLRAGSHCEIHFFPGYFFQSGYDIMKGMALPGGQIENSLVRRVEKINDKAAGILDMKKLPEFRTISPESDRLGFEMGPDKANGAVGISGIAWAVDKRRT